MANIRNQNICEKCKHKEEFPNGFPCWRCIGIDLDNELFISEEFFVMEKTTNADRIRVMTDEELAVLLDHVCPPPNDIDECLVEKNRCSMKEECQQCWLDWLRKEAKE